jgi:hypothetical protein
MAVSTEAKGAGCLSDAPVPPLALLIFPVQFQESVCTPVRVFAFGRVSRLENEVAYWSKKMLCSPVDWSSPWFGCNAGHSLD